MVIAALLLVVSSIYLAISAVTTLWQVVMTVMYAVAFASSGGVAGDELLFMIAMYGGILLVQLVDFVITLAMTALCWSAAWHSAHQQSLLRVWLGVGAILLVPVAHIFTSVLTFGCFSLLIWLMQVFIGVVVAGISLAILMDLDLREGFEGGTLEGDLSM